MIRKCELCGGELPDQSGKRGRPRVFHDECRKIDQLLGWSENLLSDLTIDNEHKKKLRGRLWYLANCLNGKAS